VGGLLNVLRYNAGDRRFYLEDVSMTSCIGTDVTAYDSIDHFGG
jgi:hypothetical protein